MHRLRRSRTYARIASHVPRTLRRLGSGLAERSVKPAEVPIAEVVRYLRPRQQERTAELRELLGRDFPEWKTLYAESEAAHPPLSLSTPRRAPFA